MNTTTTTTTAIIDLEHRKAFDLGECFVTKGANRAFAFLEQREMLIRHARNDWGDICEEDKLANQYALHDGSRLVSKYKFTGDREALVITEAEDERGSRPYTTILLPEEY